MKNNSDFCCQTDLGPPRENNKNQWLSSQNVTKTLCIFSCEKTPLKYKLIDCTSHFSNENAKLIIAAIMRKRQHIS